MPSPASGETVIRCIERGWAENWTSPTVRELADCCGISLDHAFRMLERMVQAGQLERKTLSSRRVLYRVKT